MVFWFCAQSLAHSRWFLLNAGAPYTGEPQRLCLPRQPASADEWEHPGEVMRCLPASWETPFTGWEPWACGEAFSWDDCSPSARWEPRSSARSTNCGGYSPPARVGTPVLSLGFSQLTGFSPTTEPQHLWLPPAPIGGESSCSKHGCKELWLQGKYSCDETARDVSRHRGQVDPRDNPQ